MKDPLEIKYAALKDPGIRAFMIAGERFYPANAVSFTLAQQRDFYDLYCAHFRKPRPENIAVKHFAVGPVICRLNEPKPSKELPMMLYLHGGGYMLGGFESHDDVCAEISARADIAVVGVNYRLAPEHPFPAAFDDAWAVLQHLSGQFGKIIVGGDSAGGNLSAALDLKARDFGGPEIAGQVLVYPGLGGDITKGSYISEANAPGLATKDVLYYRNIYKGGSHKFAEPLRETNFAGLPPAFLRARHMSEPARKSFSAIVNAAHQLAHHGNLPD